MPCDFCRTPDGIDKLKTWIHTNYNIKTDIPYCPVCGEGIHIREFINMMFGLPRAILEPKKEYVEIDGEKLEVERPKCEIAAEIKPLNFDLMNIDLDKVCIDKEIEWLEEMRFKDSKEKWDEFAEMRRKNNESISE